MCGHDGVCHHGSYERMSAHNGVQLCNMATGTHGNTHNAAKNPHLFLSNYGGNGPMLTISHKHSRRYSHLVVIEYRFIMSKK